MWTHFENPWDLAVDSQRNPAAAPARPLLVAMDIASRNTKNSLSWGCACMGNPVGQKPCKPCTSGGTVFFRKMRNMTNMTSEWSIAEHWTERPKKRHVLRIVVPIGNGLVLIMASAWLCLSPVGVVKAAFVNSYLAILTGPYLLPRWCSCLPWESWTVLACWFWDALEVLEHSGLLLSIGTTEMNQTYSLLQ